MDGETTEKVLDRCYTLHHCYRSVASCSVLTCACLQSKELQDVVALMSKKLAEAETAGDTPLV